MKLKETNIYENAEVLKEEDTDGLPHHYSIKFKKTSETKKKEKKIKRMPLLVT